MVVTLSMAAAGYAVNISDILDTEETVLLSSFAQATEAALLVLGGLLLISVTLSILKGGRPASVTAEPVPDQEPAPTPEAQKTPAD